jgi:hypothetical protein
MEKVDSFKQYVRDTVYVVSSRYLTGAFMSKAEAQRVFDHYKLMTPECYLFTSQFDSLGEFLTTEEINIFKDKHKNYLKILEERNEKNTVSTNSRNS